MTIHNSRIGEATKSLEAFCASIDKWRIHDDLLLCGKPLPSLYMSHDDMNRIQDAIRVVVGANKALTELVPVNHYRKKAAQKRREA